MADPSSAEAAAGPRTVGSPTAAATDFTRTVMAAAGMPLRLKVVSDQASGIALASAQSGATAPAHSPAHPSTETPGPIVPAAQAGVVKQEGASGLAPLTPSSPMDTVAPGAQAALVTAAAAADPAAGGDETGAFAFRDGSVNGRLGATGRTGGRAGIALKSTPDQVAVHITRAARSGTNRIEIRLDPESLGHVEVRLEVGRDGRVSALVLTETREALDALKAEARALQQALHDAGLKPDAASLTFDMRGEHGRRSANHALLSEDQAARANAPSAAETEPKSAFRSAEPRRAGNPRSQLDVLA
jgi:flagellar hook-length control protein FliK